MNVTHRITGYDKRTERRELEFDIPDDRLDQIYELARVPATQKENFGSFLLDKKAAWKIASHLDITLNIENYDWYFEPFAV